MSNVGPASVTLMSTSRVRWDIYSSEWPDSAENQWPATYHYYTDLIFTVLKCQTVQIWL